MKFLITGGAGFIGSNLVKTILSTAEDYKVLNLDKLTYAGNLESLKDIEYHKSYRFIQGDICDSDLVQEVFSEFKPDIVMHLAAESHVDRSINSSIEFIKTNILGTHNLLECSRNYYNSLEEDRRKTFKFHHISTDEVYGDLRLNDPAFTEMTPYDPSSPYSASKASSDHLVRSWHRTYELPVVITNCSNNYGPFHFPEKLIPLMILNALDGKDLPIYGNGKQVRDWLYVEDHARALLKVALHGKVGETYNIGGSSEKQNIEVVSEICTILEKAVPENPHSLKNGKGFKSLIKFVEDRPGHDQRYAIDTTKISNELGWSPVESFSTGLEKTIRWYLDNSQWCSNVLDGSYKRERLGIL